MTIASALLRRLGAWGTRRLLRRIRRVTHRLPLTLRSIEVANILVVAPHMDDEVIGPGGTLALHQRAGSEVRVAFCARGATSAADAVRRAEARACGDFMGFADLRWLDFPEGTLALHEQELSAALANLIAETAPRQIFVPFPTDHHRDHTAAAVALARAIRESGWHGNVWCFEVWSPSWPNVAIDISSVVEQKRRAISLHSSQVAGLHYVDGILGLNRYRALRVYVEYVEAFWVASEAQFVELAGEMDRI